MEFSEGSGVQAESPLHPEMVTAVALAPPIKSLHKRSDPFVFAKGKTRTETGKCRRCRSEFKVLLVGRTEKRDLAVVVAAKIGDQPKIAVEIECEGCAATVQIANAICFATWASLARRNIRRTIQI